MLIFNFNVFFENQTKSWSLWFKTKTKTKKFILFWKNNKRITEYGREGGELSFLMS